MSFLSFLFSPKQQQNTITILDKPSYKMAITSKKVQLVDVRTPKEFHSGHIENAKNIDFLNQSVFVSEFSKLNKEEPIYLYCRSGNRSLKAAKKLDRMGFQKIIDLKGGYLNWK